MEDTTEREEDENTDLMGADEGEESEEAKERALRTERFEENKPCTCCQVLLDVKLSGDETGVAALEETSEAFKQMAWLGSPLHWLWRF